MAYTVDGETGEVIAEAKTEEMYRMMVEARMYGYDVVTCESTESGDTIVWVE